MRSKTDDCAFSKRLEQVLSANRRMDPPHSLLIVISKVRFKNLTFPSSVTVANRSHVDMTLF